MTNNQSTDERLSWLHDAATELSNTNLKMTMGPEDLLRLTTELQERRKAAMDSEPVAWLAIYHGEVYDEAIGITRSVVEAQADHFGWESALTEIIPLYRHAQPTPERDQVRSEHAEWSQTTFGNVGPIGPLKHLSKEALEAAAEPGDLSEWADMQFLLWDAQRRAGITDEQITQAMIEKLSVNKQREWPEPKDGEPRLHIKAQPVPVVPEEKPMPNTLSMYSVDAVAAIAEVKGWNACRAAMLQAEPVKTANKLGNSPEQGESRCCTKGAPALDSPSKNAESRCGNSPAIPDGYVMVPKEPTVNQWAAGVQAFDSGVDKVTRIYKAMLAAAPQEVSHD